MIDQNSQFMAILTAVGEAKQANADALGIPWTFSKMGVGDANGTDPVPSRTQTKLINERNRAPLNQVKVDPKNTNVVIAEQVIPENVGGWWIREIGLYDADGDLVAVANCAPSFKPLLAQGSGKTQVVRMNFIVTSAANVTLKIDPSVVLATRQYVDDRLLTRLPLAGGEMTGNITLLNGRSVLLIAQDTSSWASGMLCRTRLNNETLGGLGVWGNQGTVNCVYMGLGKSPWITGNGVRVTANGVDVTGPLSGDGSGLTNLKWSALESTPTDLGTYGVTFASQKEAEAGKEAGTPMSPLRVFQAITAKVIQATENIVGIARIASQVLVNLGEDDASIVTPKKLRFGLSYLLGVNGYYVFPTWMGGLIIQWGLASSVGQASTGAGPYRDVTLPIAFPIACLGVQASMNFSAMTTSSAHAPGATIVSKSVIRLQNNYTSSAGEIMYFAIGL